jgi:hypothetical protein
MRHRTWISILGGAMLTSLFSCSNAPQPMAAPAPRAPMEDITYANEWPSPNGTISANRLFAGAGLANATQHAVMVAYQLGAG